MILDFYIHTYFQNPRPVIDACKKHFPDARIFLLVDGDDQPYDHRPCIRFPERLKPQRRHGADGTHGGGSWLKRWFTFALAQNSDIAIKVDPDSKVHRPFRVPPPQADVFGCIMETRPGRIVHGGSQGLSRDFMRRAIPLLSDERYLAPAFDMQDGTVSCDKVVADLAERLDVPLTPWGEVTYFPFPWSSTRYAISHGRWHKE